MGEFIEVENTKVPIGSHFGKTIVFGCDHRGFLYKEKIIEFLKKEGYKIIDIGCFTGERCDYPKISNDIGREVSSDYLNKIGIGICGSGIGILIPASKHKKVYCARCLNPKEAQTSRMHNNTNMLGIGADYISLDLAVETIKTWLSTSFYSNPSSEESYLRRYIQTVKLEEEINKV